MNHDSNSHDSGDEARSSTIISVAQRVASFSSVIDELVVRVYSFMRPDDEDPNSIDACNVNLAETGPILVLEADAWWNDHALGQLGFEQKRELIRDMLSRAPIDGALLSLGVFARERFRLLEREDIDVLHSWCVQLISAHRKIALALAGIVMARWYSERPEVELEQYLVEQFDAGALPELNVALAVCLGLLQNEASQQARLIMRLLVRLQRNIGVTAVEQFGGLLGRLWGFLPEEVEKWLGENSRFISRKVFRLSVERMPSHVRLALTQRWKEQRGLRGHDGGSDDA